MSGNGGRIDISSLVNMDSPRDVFAEVVKIVSIMFPDFDSDGLKCVFADIARLFNGMYPGYRSCNTYYHDLRHTTDATLAMARLIHGAYVEGVSFEERSAKLGIVSALLHDTGYIQTADDMVGTGAKYTLVHVSRSIEFTRKYLGDIGYPEADIILCVKLLECTGLENKLSKICFESEEEALLGKMLGTADLLGQMANRSYPENLLILYYEFEEGKVPGFNSELELLEKSPAFYEFTLSRFKQELGGVDRYMLPHFKARWDIDKDLYAEAIDKHAEYIKHLVTHHKHDYRAHLRRSGKVRYAIEREQQLKGKKEEGPPGMDMDAGYASERK